MKKDEVQKLPHGLYKIFWKSKYGGGSSLAAVGSLYNGDRWMAPTNWTGKISVIGFGESWEKVKKVKKIQ